MKNLDKYLKKEGPLTNEEEEELYKRGKYAGTLLAGTGLTGAGLSYAIEKGKEGELAKKILGENSEKLLKTAKYGNLALAGAGTTVAGVSAYKHYKHKKKLKGEKEKGDDNSKD